MLSKLSRGFLSDSSCENFYLKQEEMLSIFLENVSGRFDL